MSKLDRSELITILQENLSATDEWGGCKLASWQWGGNVVIDGIDSAADAILARLSKVEEEAKDTDEDLGNVIPPQPCPVGTCLDNFDGECGEGDFEYDTCEKRRKAIEEEEKR